MGNWFHLDIADIWWYMPDMSDRVIAHERDGYFILTSFADASGPYDSLEAAQAAYLILMEE